MNFELLILIVVLLVNLALIYKLFFLSSKSDESNLDKEIKLLQQQLSQQQEFVRSEFSVNRQEAQTQARQAREELRLVMEEFSRSMMRSMLELGQGQKQEMSNFAQVLELFRKSQEEKSDKLQLFMSEKIASMQVLLDQELKENRKESTLTLEAFRKDMLSMLDQFRLEQKNHFETMIRFQSDQQLMQAQKQEQMRETLERKMLELQTGNEKKLEEMRLTVDEKLQKTLNDRLGQSFETVSKHLQAVQEGLGEMKNLAQDVGGLKRVLSNVKMRGGIGEVQLSMLLENILSPEQYAANVMTKKGSQELVEFAIRLPGREEQEEVVWLPVDAKFPKDVYEHLQNCYDEGDLQKIEQAQKQMEQTIKKMARDIRDKYLDPPNTTDFGILFLPFEGIYAEVVRKASLLEELQRDYKIIVTGPTTLAAILNSLQMGFRTLAIQKRSSEVWRILGAVKKEFEQFGLVLEKAKKSINSAGNQLEDIIGKRTRAINRSLRGVEALDIQSARTLLPDDGITEESPDTTLGENE